MKSIPLLVLLAIPVVALAAKPCEELKSEVAAKIDAAGAKGYLLEIVKADADAGDSKVVGTCDGGKNKILYRREGSAGTPKPAASDAKAK